MNNRDWGYGIVATLCLAGSALAENSTKAADYRNKIPYVFAGIQYGAPFSAVIDLLGQPEASESAGAAKYLYWAGKKLRVSYQDKSRLISGFTVIGPEGVAAVRRIHKEPLLGLVGKSAADAIQIMGPPSNKWYENQRYEWEYAVDSRTSGALFLECLKANQYRCNEMQVHWTGTAIWNPND